MLVEIYAMPVTMRVLQENLDGLKVHCVAFLRKPGISGGLPDWCLGHIVESSLERLHVCSSGMDLFEEALRRWEEALTFRGRQTEDEENCAAVKTGAGDAIAEHSMEVSAKGGAVTPLQRAVFAHVKLIPFFFIFLMAFKDLLCQLEASVAAACKLESPATSTFTTAEEALD